MKEEGREHDGDQWCYERGRQRAVAAMNDREESTVDTRYLTVLQVFSFSKSISFLHLYFLPSPNPSHPLLLLEVKAAVEAEGHRLSTFNSVLGTFFKINFLSLLFFPF